MDLFALFNNTTSAVKPAEAKTEVKAEVKPEELKSKVSEANETKVVEMPVSEEVKTEVSEVKADEPKSEGTKSDVKDIVPEQTTLSQFMSLPTANISDDDEDEDDESDEASDDEGEKKPATAKKSGGKKIDGPVTVKGCGWTLTVGESGKKYTGKDVLKACFEAGYKEVLCADNVMDGNTVLVKTVSKKCVNEDVQMGDNVTVMLGNFRVQYNVTDFAPLTKEEISLFDVALKFQDDNPDFKGCSLVINHDAFVATPVFSQKLKPKKSETYSVWTENGIKEVEGAALADSKANIYQSESGVLFIEEALEGKTTNISISADDLGLEKVKASNIKELYRLPATLFVETYGQKFQISAEAFGGRDVIDQSDITDLLKQRYRLFRSSNRQLSFNYDRNSATIGVAVVSGKKGAAAMAAPVIDFCSVLKNLTRRIEDTELGIFKGYQNDTTLEVTGLSFDMKLPKIPSRILDTIVAEFRRDTTKENMVQIYWSVKDKSYYIVKPNARYTKVSVLYEMTHTNDILVMTVHSHNTMRAFFSSVDDEDEIYTGLFGVIGNLDKVSPSMLFRAGMEGCFKELSVDLLFSKGGEVA